MNSGQLPRIDLTRCTGCRRCVEVCPTQALAQVAGKAQLAFPARCTWCTACEAICPDDAIALPFLVIFAPSQSAARDDSSSHVC